MRTALLFILVLFFSCAQVTKKNDNVFAVSNNYQLKIDSLKKGLLDIPPPPPAPFYISHHFLVDSLGQMFYYHLDQRGWFCGTGYDYNVPLFLGLKPNDLIQIPEESVQEFIRLNILNQEPSERVVCVGLLKDTIISNGIARLRDVLKGGTSKARWFIRKATLEEETVLDYKKNQRNYSPEDIKWDSARIKFLPTSTNFKPPKFEE